MEKAFSKAFGTYQDLEVNRTPLTQLLKDLTSAPVDNLFLNDFYGDILDIINEGIRYGFIIMVTNELSETHKEICMQYGLPSEFSYQIMKTDEDKIILRNPFGWIEDTPYSVERDE